MKRIIFLFILALTFGYVYADNFTNKVVDVKLNFNKTIDSTIVVNLDIPKTITSFSLSGTCKLSDAERSLFRAVLVDQDDNEYLVSEFIGYLQDSKNINFKENCIETIELDKIKAKQLKLIIFDSKVHITNIEYGTSISSSQKQELKNIKKEQKKYFVKKYNEHNKLKNYYWIASDSSKLANLTYAQKKQIFGNNSDYFQTDGIEYYTSGFFVVSNTAEPLNRSLPTISNYVNNFTWQRRHGRNWNTSVKSQIEPATTNGNGGCWAFSAVAVAESFANLYYNQKIDLDLSEQQVISCSNQGNNVTGGYSHRAAAYIANNGIINESCFPFSNSDESCSNKCSSPELTFKPQKCITKTLNCEDSIKHYLIHYGPLVSSIYNTFYSHAMALVGYGTIKEGDNLNYLFDKKAFIDSIIPANSPLIGHTYWIFKNSSGKDEYHNGYLYAIFDDFSLLNKTFSYFSGVESLTGYSNNDILCQDLDGDGYYNWGIGPKPSHCPNCPNTPDGNDYNPNVGGMNNYGFSIDLSNSLEEPYISGPNIIDCSAKYAVYNINENVEVIWKTNLNAPNSAITTSPLISLNSLQGEAMVDYRIYINNTNKRSYSGTTNIYAILKSGNVYDTLSKTVQVLANSIPYVNSGIVPSKGTTRTINELNCGDVPSNKLKWSITTPTSFITAYGHSYTITFSNTGKYTFKIENLESCFEENSYSFSYSISDSGFFPGIFTSVSTNNPVSNTLSININTNNEEIDMNKEPLTIEIWNNFGKLRTLNINSKNQDIDVSDLNEGLYILRVLKNNILVDTSTFMVKK